VLHGQARHPQADRFLEAARALECDDDATRFDTRLKKVAQVKPEADAKPPTDPE
jgi:hypothetical protein